MPDDEGAGCDFLAECCLADMRGDVTSRGECVTLSFSVGAGIGGAVVAGFFKNLFG